MPLQQFMLLISIINSLFVHAGVVNVILTTPMWVVNTRLKLQGVRFRNEDLHPTQYRGIFGVCCTSVLYCFFLSVCLLRLDVFWLSDAFSQIISNEGVRTLWNGVLPSLVLVLNPAVQFMIYEAMKRRAGKGGRKARKILLLPIFYHQNLTETWIGKGHHRN